MASSQPTSLIIPVAAKKTRQPSGAKKKINPPVDPEAGNPVGLRMSLSHAMEHGREEKHREWLQQDCKVQQLNLESFRVEAEKRQSSATPTSKSLPLAAIGQACLRLKTTGMPWHERWRLQKEAQQKESFHRDYLKRLKQRRHWQKQLTEVESSLRAVQEEVKHPASTGQVASTPVRVSGSREDIWRQMVRKDVPKVAKMLAQNTTNRLANVRRLGAMAARAARRLEGRRARQARDVQLRAKRAMREMLAFWRRNEREEREARKKAEREALERQRQEEEAREARRQARKLDFLITQTELYSHFIGSKVRAGEEEVGESKPLDFAEASDEAIRAEASKIAQRAAQAQLDKTATFDRSTNLSLAAPKAIAEDVQQPRMLQAQLKPYQLIGLRWLANLYEQGINGILADEMGLGKTIQAISLLAYLAETHNLWGPFLIVAPASTLHNWQQELERFVPSLRVIPYWGNVSDRKTLRRLLNPKRLYTRDSPFHILVTSYQLVMQMS